MAAGARSPDYAGFLAALPASGFAGDIEAGIDSRLVLATDNSIYQVLPAGAVFPRTPDDIDRVVTLAASGLFGPVVLTARGGGTGTNGQSLSDGVLVDCSRHLTGIGPFDPESETISVEPGVVLDQLNAFLAPLGYFFPPDVSTASRATIGGMVATDASGKGSRHYGRTSDYVRALEVILADSTPMTLTRLDAAQLESAPPLHKAVHAELKAVADTVARVFPAMNRGLTGYNLQQALPADGGLDMTRLLAGSEGTLALTKRITLKLARRPALTALVAVFYESFAAALDDVPRLVTADPLAVEILDDKILRLAQTDPVWAEIGGLFGAIEGPVGAVNYVEVTADSADALTDKLARVERLLADAAPGQGPHRVVRDGAAIRAAWSLRQKSVGLLGALEADRPGIPFVEDTAVPPERLADYVRRFRAILDEHGVDYGMFGHADVGCLHVRPTINMRDPAQQVLIRQISDAVAALAHECGGLLWGEHGRGLRGEYARTFFGPELLPVLSRIKALFDPENRFNPGKLATPDGSPVTRVDEKPFRGTRDAEITGAFASDFGKAVACNGNGACHSWSAADAMCPSYKATGDKRLSPKGRASLLREWAAQSGQGHADPDLTEALRQSLSACLSCRACASACPVKIDIPTMKSRFLDRFYQSRRRPLRHLAMRWMEPVTLLARHAPRLANGVLHNPVGAAIARQVFGLVDLPRFSHERLEAGLRRLGIAGVDALASDASRGVVLLPDSFNAAFDTRTLIDAAGLLAGLGFDVRVAPILQNGKALDVLGFGKAFARRQAERQRKLAELAALGLPLVGLEPAVNAIGLPGGPPVLGLDQFLYDRLAGLPAGQGSGPAVTVLTHCTEKTADPGVTQRWRAIAARLGVTLEAGAAGCCGMSGLFGHEAENASLSRRIFDLSWRAPLAEGPVVATGFSCRCQSERLTGLAVVHPVSLLVDRLFAAEAGHAEGGKRRSRQLMQV